MILVLPLLLFIVSDDSMITFDRCVVLPRLRACYYERNGAALCSPKMHLFTHSALYSLTICISRREFIIYNIAT